ncbi:MAG: large subunit ribosomal protein L22 [Chloroflexi bacterium]|jgi:large subunit ribosomal protein L22|nr:MAG: large subunit ribosomal protein L22 [Chloroflexota bacterium]
MQVKATAKYIRLSPRKARMIFQGLRGMPVEEALIALRFTPKPGAKQVAKVVESAAANAESNYDIPAGDLRIDSIFAGDARTLHRFRAAARGRVQPQLKRTCHITVIVTDGQE